MGLTIYYDLAVANNEPEARVREIVEALRHAALALPAERVTPVSRMVVADCEGLERRGLDLDWLVCCFATRGVEDPRDSSRFLPVLPTVAYGFGAVVGRCEPVVLGLGRYPRIVVDAGTEVPTALEGWSWHACTKTQYASLQGMDHFVACHRAVIALLDATRALGIAVEVRDDSGYWDHRDERRLVESAEYWNALAAKIAGRLADGLEPTGLKADAPVFRHPEFEQLEME